MKSTVFFLFIFFFHLHLSAQPSSEWSGRTPTKYKIGKIEAQGLQFTDAASAINLSGLKSGQEITLPGEDIGLAIRTLWRRELFSDVRIEITEAGHRVVNLTLHLQENPRVQLVKLEGLKKQEAEDFKISLGLHKGKIISSQLPFQVKDKVRRYFSEKGYHFADAEVKIVPVLGEPSQRVVEIKVDRKQKTRIKSISISGNEALSDGQIRRRLGETKEQSRFHFSQGVRSIFKKDDPFLQHFRIGVFKSSKFQDDLFASDQIAAIRKYRQLGYRDARITHAKVDTLSPSQLAISLEVVEGSPYYFRNITWVGNKKYSAKQLHARLGIRKGDKYDEERLERRLFMDPTIPDISTMYMDSGYLFFRIDPIETAVTNDSIDLELRVYEGGKAYLNDIIISNNIKTSDHVIRRELFTMPGQLFRRSDIIRSQQNLMALGYFDPNKLEVIPLPDPSTGTVDLEYKVEEAFNDRIELSGGWGGGQIVGTLGFTINNFSGKKFFKAKEWDPLPMGDGQSLSMRVQSSGENYQSFSATFSEPWLGGKKPNLLSATTFYTRQRLGTDEAPEELDIIGLSIGSGQRINFPDNYTFLRHDLTYQRFNLNNWENFTFSDGVSHNLSWTTQIARSNVNHPIYPTKGSDIKMSLQVTPPYSLFSNDDYSKMPDEEKYKWAEYHKWKFTYDNYTSIKNSKLVLHSSFGTGFLGSFSRQIGISPFERFYLGGSGISGFQMDGRELVSLRGYDERAVSPETGASIVQKASFELRYPISLRNEATVYVLGFADFGNSWDGSRAYSPFDMRRSVGVGLRVNLPMIGLVGIDWGYRFDDVPGVTGMPRSQVHFTFGSGLGKL